jgi:hypothetical protein
MTKARQLADLGNAYDDGALSNRNLIINGAMQVAQRGDYSSSTSVASGAYSIDRWKANDPFNLQRFTGQVVDGIRTNYVKVSYNGTQTMGFMQLIEDKNYERLRGQTITISAYVRTNQPLFGFRLYDGGQNYGPRFNADGNWHRATWTVNWSPSSPSYFQIMFDTYTGSFPTIGSGDYMDIAMVQVEVGDTATPFEHRSYGDELLACKRYFQRIAGGESGITGSAIMTGVMHNSTFLEGIYKMEVEMRTEPTLERVAGTDYYGFSRNGAQDTFNSISIDSGAGNPRQVNLYNATEVSGTAGQGGIVFSKVEAAIVSLSAEL